MKASFEGKGITEDQRRLLILRAAELSARGENSAVASSFLTPAEQRTVFEAQKGSGGCDRLFLWGGYSGATRRKAVFLPLWAVPDGDIPDRYEPFSEERENYFVRTLTEYGQEDILRDFICPLRLLSGGYTPINHRDWLGALMALGLKRNVIGDIVKSSEPEGTYLFCDVKSADFIKSELTRAGRDAVTCEDVPEGEKIVPVKDFEKISFTAASPRADAVVRSLCALSREKAAEIILSGLVELNYFPLSDTTKHISPGDVISVRGYGKFVIDSTDGTTKKGRTRIEVRKYK